MKIEITDVDESELQRFVDGIYQGLTDVPVEEFIDAVRSQLPYSDYDVNGSEDFGEIYITKRNYDH